MESSETTDPLYQVCTRECQCSIRLPEPRLTHFSEPRNTRKTRKMAPSFVSFVYFVVHSIVCNGIQFAAVPLPVDSPSFDSLGDDLGGSHLTKFVVSSFLIPISGFSFLVQQFPVPIPPRTRYIASHDGSASTPGDISTKG